MGNMTASVSTTPLTLANMMHSPSSDSSTPLYEGWRSLAYGPLRMTVWLGFTSTTAVKKLPNAAMAAMRKATPASTIAAPAPTHQDIAAGIN